MKFDDFTNINHFFQTYEKYKDVVQIRASKTWTKIRIRFPNKVEGKKDKVRQVNRRKEN